MPNDYYTPSGNPQTLNRGSSAVIRAEFDSLQNAFDLLPTITQSFSGSANYAVDTGVVNAYVIAVNPAIVSVSQDGLSFVFKTANANTGASTLNTVDIVRPDGTALQAGDIVAGINQVTYNSTKSKFELSSLSSVVAANNAAASAAAAAASAASASSSASNAATSETNAATSASLAQSYVNALTSTSTTSLTIGTGAKVFTTQVNKGYAAGQFFSAISAANSANYMHGTVTSYSGTTLTVNVTDIGGSGTLADWNLSVSGSQGSIGPQGPSGSALLLASTRTSNIILGASDFGSLIDVTSGTFTQTITAAATLGDGWWCYYRNRGTGTVTIDPNGSETIDGVTSGTVPPGMTILIQCNGTSFTCIRVGTRVKTEVLTSGSSWTCPLGVRVLRVRGCGGGGGTDTGAGRNQGSAGGYFEDTYATTPGTAVTYAIGAAGGTTSPCTGGTTTWDTFTANGGTTSAAMAAGGTASGASITMTGGGTFIPAASSSIGFGGSNPLGQGGAANNSFPGSTNATGYGSGAATYSGLGSKSGQQGVIILEY